MIILLATCQMCPSILNVQIIAVFAISTCFFLLEVLEFLANRVLKTILPLLDEMIWPTGPLGYSIIALDQQNSDRLKGY